MPSTFHKIASSTVGSGGAATISFTSIPGTYTDLVLKISASIGTGGSGGNGQAMYITLNGSTSNFTGRYLYGSGSAASSGSLARYVGSINPSGAPNNMEIYFPNYSESTNKSFSVDNVDEGNFVAADMNLIAGLWSNTATITSISIANATSNFVQYSTATLYGISKT